jgi:dephospho-CoA kinase
LGSGKSTVARMMEELGGAFVVDADAIARRVQQPGGAAYGEIVAAFGKSILLQDGSIDRGRLGRVVFSDPGRLEQLNRIVHPRVREEEHRLLDAHKGDPLVVLDVPLLLENRMEPMVDRVVVVTVGDQERLERMWRRSGMEPGEVNKRLAAQMPQDEKVRRAHHVISNNGSLDDTREQVVRLLGELGVTREAK